MSRFRSLPAADRLPRRGFGVDRDARLPFALALLLVAGGALQLAFGSAPVDVPVPIGSVRLARRPPPVVTAVTVPAEIAERDLFRPRIASADGTPTPELALAGAVVSGTVAVKGRRLALVSASDGRRYYLAPGGSIAGWVLTALEADRARFAKGSERIEAPYGAQATLNKPAETEEADQQ